MITRSHPNDPEANCCGHAAGTQVQPPQIEREMKNAFDALLKLPAVVEELETRLVSVLRPPTTTANENEQDPAKCEPIAPMADELSVITQDINIHLQSLRNILRRIEL